MKTFTVIGLLDEDGQLAVAGVVYGAQDLADASYATKSLGLQRWAMAVEATSPEEAERLARKLALDGD